VVCHRSSRVRTPLGRGEPSIARHILHITHPHVQNYCVLRTTAALARQDPNESKKRVQTQ